MKTAATIHGFGNKQQSLLMCEAIFFKMIIDFYLYPKGVSYDIHHQGKAHLSILNYLNDLSPPTD
jgi:hypothetical protein